MNSDNFLESSRTRQARGVGGGLGEPGGEPFLEGLGPLYEVFSFEQQPLSVGGDAAADNLSDSAVGISLGEPSRPTP